MYSNTKTSLKALDDFKAKQTKYTESELNTLEVVLKKLEGYQPSPFLVKQWTLQYGHEENVPEQLHRDMRIVDSLHRQYKMELSRAQSLWCDWEDYEYELVNSARIQ